MSIDVSKALPVVIDLGPAGHSPARIEISGKDITNDLRGFVLSANVDDLATLRLEAVCLGGTRIAAQLAPLGIDIGPALRSGDRMTFSVGLLRELLRQEFDDAELMTVKVSDIVTNPNGTKVVRLISESFGYEAPRAEAAKAE